VHKIKSSRNIIRDVKPLNSWIIVMHFWLISNILNIFFYLDAQSISRWSSVSRSFVTNLRQHRETMKWIRIVAICYMRISLSPSILLILSDFYYRYITLFNKQRCYRCYCSFEFSMIIIRMIQYTKILKEPKVE
jgi:hypothetical protein